MPPMIGKTIPIKATAIIVKNPIIGGIEANSGELWEYPMTIKFIR